MSEIDIYNKYKLACPNSTAKFKPTQRNVLSWLRHIDNHRRNKVLKNSMKVVYDNDKLKEYSKLVRYRRITSYSSAPEYLQKIIDDNVKEIVLRYDFVFEIYLEGSYLKGGYIDKNTTKEEKRILGLLRDVTKESDIDFSVNGGEFIKPNFYKGNDIIYRSTNSVLLWSKKNGYT